MGSCPSLSLPPSLLLELHHEFSMLWDEMYYVVLYADVWFELQKSGLDGPMKNKVDCPHPKYIKWLLQCLSILQYFPLVRFVPHQTEEETSGCFFPRKSLDGREDPWLQLRMSPLVKFKGHSRLTTYLSSSCMLSSPWGWTTLWSLWEQRIA